jgi:DNA-binding transcriptional ArsR family regulator
MVKYQSAALDATFGALADPTRRAILERLAQGEALVTELARPFDMTLPAVSKHLGVLERAGLVVRHRDGRVRRCRFLPGPMAGAASWIEMYREFWEGRLDQLARYLKESSGREAMPWPAGRRPRKPSASPGSSRPRARRSSGPGPDPMN